MTPISRIDGNLVVRTSSDKPSPYLKSLNSWIDAVVHYIPNDPMRAIDVGCGGGRNSDFLKERGFDVLSFDRHPDYGFKYDFEKYPLMLFKKSVHIALLQYSLMFINGDARDRLIEEIIGAMADFPSLIVIELYPAKNSFMPTAEEVIKYKAQLMRRFKQSNIPNLVKVQKFKFSATSIA